MQTCLTDITRLKLLIERILDADLLSETESTPLLLETEAIRHALEAGDTEAARQHLEHLARLTEALVQTEALALSDGRTVIQFAEGILNPETDAGV